MFRSETDNLPEFDLLPPSNYNHSYNYTTYTPSNLYYYVKVGDEYKYYNVTIVSCNYSNHLSYDSQIFVPRIPQNPQTLFHTIREKAKKN